MKEGDYSIGYAILFVCLLAGSVKAQSVLSGLGDYRVGITTPASLNQVGFREQNPLLVKGTIAMACEHIRVFKAPEPVIENLPVTNLTLIFYDNRLARISCDYSPQLDAIFRKKHGEGLLLPKSRTQLCPEATPKPMDIWREIWQQKDIVALVIRTSGYNKDCALQETGQLTIASQRLMELSSDCDLQPADPFIDAFTEALSLLRERDTKPKVRNR